LVVAAQTLLALAYPFIVYAALQFVEPRAVALASLLLLLLRFALVSRAKLLAQARAFAGPAVAIALASSATLFANDARVLMLTPALVNLALLATFALSFLQDETVVERLARAGVGALPPEAVAYCRTVTAVWCGFFVLNAAISLELALAGSPRAWALYTGLVGYVLMGLLFGAEYLVRQRRFGRTTS
jgi:uncharacterized membrane protein